MHSVGPEVQDIADTLVTEDNPLDTVEATLEALATYFAPQMNIRYERVLFRKIRQESGETTDTFVTRLRKLAETCEFLT